MKDLRSFLKELDKELTGNILPFWSNQMVDHTNGGFYGRIDGSNHLEVTAPKGSVLNARILWTYSAAYRKYNEQSYLEQAQSAYNYCIRYFLNYSNEGVYWMVDYKGNPVDTKNQIYALSFMIYGLTEYHMATGNKESLEKAINLFRSIEKHSFDKNINGYFEAYDEQWVLLEDLRLSEKDENEKKTMNTHLHILEAYTNLYRIWKDEALEKQLKNLLRVFIDHIIDPAEARFKLFFDENWNSKGTEISYGHDIEGSWLLLEAAEVLGDSELINYIKLLAVRMVDKVMEDGFDKDGGLFYEANPEGVFDHDKHWWPQAEALVGLVNAFQLTQDKKYLEQALMVWAFIKDKIIDSKDGEWFFYVNREGIPYKDEDKAGFWKCPYHNSRACLEVLKRIS